MFILMQIKGYFNVKTVENTNMHVEQCALMQVFRKGPGCVLIGACVLIRTNTVFVLFLIQNIDCGYSCTHNVRFEQKY